MIAKVLAKSIKAIAFDIKLQMLRHFEVSGILHHISKTLGLLLLCGSTAIIKAKYKSAAAAAKLLQLCPTLWDPIDGSPPGSAIPGILQARTLEWVAIAFSIVWKWKVKVKSFSRVRLVATPWTAAYQASPSMGFSRQEYRSGLPLPSPKYKSKDL